MLGKMHDYYLFVPGRGSPGSYDEEIGHLENYASTVKITPPAGKTTIERGDCHASLAMTTPLSPGPGSRLKIYERLKKRELGMFAHWHTPYAAFSECLAKCMAMTENKI